MVDDHKHTEFRVQNDQDAGGGGRPRAHSVLFARESLEFVELDLADPLPTGAQVLEAAGIYDPAQWSLVAILANGDFEDVRPTETFDVRGPGAERFVAFRTDRLFRPELRGRPLLWGRTPMRGADIIALAKPGDDEMVFLEVPGGDDVPIGPGTELDLGAPAVERLVVAKKPKPQTFEITIIYNGLARQLTVHPEHTVAAVIQAARPLFGSPGGNLVLVGQDGRELQPERTLRQEKVKAGERLSLRPPVVRGG